MGDMIRKKPVTISIPSDPKYLCVVRDVTSRIGALHGLDHGVVEQLKLAVDEACSNVMKHAYAGDTGKEIRLKYFSSAEVFEVVIDDDGPKSNPDLIKGRPLNEVRPGGLGVHFIKKIFDVFEFDKKKKEGNRLRLVKHIRQDGNTDKTI